MIDYELCAHNIEHVMGTFFTMIRAIFRFILLFPQIILDAIIYIVLEKREIIGFEFICIKQKNERKDDIRRQVLNHYLLQCYKQVYKKNDNK